MKSKRKILKIGSGIVLGIALISTSAFLEVATAGNGVSDDEISLRKGNMVVIAPSLAAPEYTAAETGDSQLKERSFYGSPPLVPHSIVDIEQTADSNECLDCHIEGDEDIPEIPATHKIKAVIKSISRDKSISGMLHQVTGHAKVTEGINNERYYCTTCHVPQADNLKPLVENTFTKSIPKDDQQDILDDLNDFDY